MSGRSAVELPLPEPMLRRPRFGPFPSVADALKFLLALAVGAVVAALAGPLLWLPFLGGGFLLATYRPDGKSIDERCGDYLRWRLRAGHRLGAAGRPVAREVVRSGGLVWSGVSAAGRPLAFLPVPEQAARFQSYRSFLDALDGPLWMVVDTEPVRAGPFRPPTAHDGDGPDGPARRAYGELLDLLVRRRRRRRVRLLLWELDTGAPGLRRLAGRLQRLEAALGTLDLPVDRLRARTLADLAPPNTGSSP